MNRKEELMSYINLLTKLKDSGMKCDKELNEAVVELHNLVLNNNESVFIFVIENTYEGLQKSRDTFKKMLGNTVNIHQSRSCTRKCELKNKHVSIIIQMYVDDYNYDCNRGLRPDYIINNGDNTLIEKMALSIK
ncbi:hypothetical protein Q7A53_06115 [Halobacillus rhizosphaerae]|uniref:hypothetical protein n=1 Tax=Halobacillus rhizosphaerae TaxID=3064889 RepID=UPI00398BBBAF